MIHVTLNLTSMQVVFDRDAILHIQYDANWSLIEMKTEALNQSTGEKCKRH